MRIALVGEEAAGAQALKRILQSDHEVVLLLSSAHRSTPGSGLGAMAAELNLRLEDPASVRRPEFAAELRRREIDVLLNVHSLFLIHPEVIQAATVGCFNLHPGPLPEYAGLNTVSWAIYEGASQYGSTLHHLIQGIDAGAIAYAARFPLDETMTAGRLMSRAVREGLGLLDRLLRQLSTDARGIPADSQDTSRRKYYGRGVPRNGRIDWATQGALEIVRFVRACDYEPFASPWGRPTALLDGLPVQVTRASRTGKQSTASPGTVGPVTAMGVLVASADEWVELQSCLLAGEPVLGRELPKRLAAAKTGG